MLFPRELFREWSMDPNLNDADWRLLVELVSLTCWQDGTKGKGERCRNFGAAVFESGEELGRWFGKDRNSMRRRINRLAKIGYLEPVERDGRIMLIRFRKRYRDQLFPDRRAEGFEPVNRDSQSRFGDVGTEIPSLGVRDPSPEQASAPGSAGEIESIGSVAERLRLQ